MSAAQCPIALKKGERYAGAIVNADGSIAYHLVLLAKRPSKRLDWAAAKAWAAKAGGELPTRREQSLLAANAKDAFEASWYWSSEAYEEDGAYAWLQGFGNGLQSNGDTSYEARVRAVRRITP
jgi:hypothetical protein